MVTGVTAGVTWVAVGGSRAHLDQRGTGGVGGKLVDDSPHVAGNQETKKAAGGG